VPVGPTLPHDDRIAVPEDGDDRKGILQACKFAPFQDSGPSLQSGALSDGGEMAGIGFAVERMIMDKPTDIEIAPVVARERHKALDAGV